MSGASPPRRAMAIRARLPWSPWGRWGIRGRPAPRGAPIPRSIPRPAATTAPPTTTATRWPGWRSPRSRIPPTSVDRWSQARRRTSRWPTPTPFWPPSRTPPCPATTSTARTPLPTTTATSTSRRSWPCGWATSLCSRSRASPTRRSMPRWPPTCTRASPSSSDWPRTSWVTPRRSRTTTARFSAARATSGSSPYPPPSDPTWPGSRAGVVALATLVLAAIAPGARAEDLTSPVSTLSGSLGAGFPMVGASVPFGMIEPGPDTGLANGQQDPVNYDGYGYQDPTIRGFSLTHFDGAGIPIAGYLPFQPTTGTVSTDAASNASPSAHATEVAQPGYYAATLARSGTRVELTATARASLMRIAYPA